MTIHIESGLVRMWIPVSSQILYVSFLWVFLMPNGFRISLLNACNRTYFYVTGYFFFYQLSFSNLYIMHKALQLYKIWDYLTATLLHCEYWMILCYYMYVLYGRIKIRKFELKLNLIFCVLLFRSPEPKAEVSFPDQNLSVVGRRWRWCCNLFTLSFSSLEPLRH